MTRKLRDSKRWRQVLGVLMCTACMAVVSVAAQAQDEPEPVRAVSVDLSLDGEDVIIAKPDGWVIAKAPRGSVALMRLAGDQSSQLDVRYNPGVDGEHRDSHFSTFHTNLKSMGLKKVSSRKVELEHDAFKGDIFENVYELTAKKKPYRLVVWHVHRKNAVWFFTLFEPINTNNSSKPLELLLTAIKIS